MGSQSVLYTHLTLDLWLKDHPHLNQVQLKLATINIDQIKIKAIFSITGVSSKSEDFIKIIRSTQGLLVPKVI